MKKFSTSIFFVMLVVVLNSCQAIGDIFKAGAVVGIIAVIIVIALLIWVISLFRGKN